MADTEKMGSPSPCPQMLKAIDLQSALLSLLMPKPENLHSLRISANFSGKQKARSQWADEQGFKGVRWAAIPSSVVNLDRVDTLEWSQ